MHTRSRNRRHFLSRSAGFSVTAAASGEEALAILEAATEAQLAAGPNDAVPGTLSATRGRGSTSVSAGFDLSDLEDDCYSGGDDEAYDPQTAAADPLFDVMLLDLILPGLQVWARSCQLRVQIRL